MTHLAHDRFAHPDGADRLAFLLHGILGSKQNWRGFARKLSRALPGWEIVTVDLRNHGDSPPLPGPHTVAACSADLAGLAEHLGRRPAVVCGHSFGGKVALATARDHPAGLDQVWVLDANPAPLSAQPGADPEVRRVMAALRSVPQPLAARSDVVAHLRGQGFSDGLARWMTTNLERRDGGFWWRFDLDAARAMIDDYFALDLWDVTDMPRAAPEIHVVRAERSDRWTDETVQRLELPPAGAPTHLHVLPDAAHWVHADNPAGLLEMMLDWWPA